MQALAMIALAIGVPAFVYGIGGWLWRRAVDAPAELVLVLIALPALPPIVVGAFPSAATAGRGSGCGSRSCYGSTRAT